MNIKIGDFGLSVMFDPTKYCGRMSGHKAGTPNYISPEILNNKGYYYETDIWAIGIILYALIVGKPPFQKKTKETTHDAIKSGVFTCPSILSTNAKKLIKDILQVDPTSRPTLSEILNYDFFTKCEIPQKLSKDI
jgi:serine/threonine protein kinase